MAAAAALAACGASYAANPFADVSTSSWAYQAVADLSAQGIVEGYPDDTFKGETSITRYEMAQIVARLMAKEDQYNASQRATIDKLAGEYTDELDSLGVKVSNLEKKVGAISWSGDARMRYQRKLKPNKNISVGPSYNDTVDHYDGRMRLNLSGQVNDKVTVKGRFLSEFNFQDGESANTEMDRLHVVYAPNEKTSIDVGRTDLWLGQTGILYDDTFDGIKASYDDGHFGVEAGYGRMIEMNSLAKLYVATDQEAKVNNDNLESYYVKLKGQTGSLRVSAFYLEFLHDSEYMKLLNDSIIIPNGVEHIDTNFKLWGVGASIEIGENWTVDGDYIQNPNDYSSPTINSAGLDKPTLWTVGLTYGTVDTDKVGSYSIGVRYVDADRYAYLGSSTLDMTDYLDGSLNAISSGQSTLTQGARFYMVKAAVAVAKNVELDAYYYFNGKGIDVALNKTVDFDDIYGIELNYTF